MRLNRAASVSGFALEASGFAALRAEAARRRGDGEAVGAGLAMFVEKSGLGPVDGVRLAVDPSGAIELVTGAASFGQGVETVLAQICAGTLGADYRDVAFDLAHLPADAGTSLPFR